MGLSPMRVRQLCQSGELPAKKHGRDWMIDEKDADAYERQPEGWPKGRPRKERTMNNPTSWPNLDLTTSWLNQFEASTEVWKLTTGGYYAGSGDDLADSDPEAIYQGAVGDLLHVTRAMDEADEERRANREL